MHVSVLDTTWALKCNPRRWHVVHTGHPWLQSPQEQTAWEVNDRKRRLPLHWFSANLKKCFLCHCLRLQHQSCSYFLPLCSPYHLHLQEISVTAWRISKMINNKVKIKTWASAIERHFWNVYGMLSDHAFPCSRWILGKICGVKGIFQGKQLELLPPMKEISVKFCVQLRLAAQLTERQTQ